MEYIPGEYRMLQSRIVRGIYSWRISDATWFIPITVIFVYKMTVSVYARKNLKNLSN